MKEKLYILHEYGAPRHFEALFYLNDKNMVYNKIILIEFAFIRQFIKGIVRKDKSIVIKSIFNFFTLLYLLVSKPKDLIIGAAPYDIRIYFLSLLKKRHNIIYYSSWPYWDFSKHPKKVYFKHQAFLWENFLRNICAVGVTSKVRDGLLQFTSNVTVIPHCINKEFFFPVSNQNQTIFRFLFVGRLTKDKGIDIILNLVKRFPNNIQTEWWFVGSGDEQDNINNMKNEGYNIRSFGRISNTMDLANIYRQCNVLLLPSRLSEKWEEIFGIVLIEAMACGVVPISSGSIGPKTIISSGEDGYIVEIENEEEIYSKCYSLLMNQSLYHQMSQAAQFKAVEYYTVESTSEKWRYVLDSINHYHEKKQFSVN